jgi:hypothetical protein
MPRQPKIPGDSMASPAAVEKPGGVDLTAALKRLSCYSPSGLTAPQPGWSCGRADSGACFDGHVLQRESEACPVEMPTMTIGRANKIHLHELRAAPGGHIPIAGYVTAAEESLPQPQFQQDIASRWDQTLAHSKPCRWTGIDQQDINACPHQDTGRHCAGRPATDNGYRVVSPGDSSSRWTVGAVALVRRRTDHPGAFDGE